MSKYRHIGDWWHLAYLACMHTADTDNGDYANGVLPQSEGVLYLLESYPSRPSIDGRDPALRPFRFSTSVRK